MKGLPTQTSRVLPCLVLLLLQFRIAGVTLTSVTENFDDNHLNTILWSDDSLGAGPVATEVNQTLELYLPADSVGTRVSGPYWTAGTMSAGVITDALLVGDFDAQISYTHLDWPYNNGARSGIGLSLIGSVQRTSFTAGEVYLTHFFDGVRQFQTADSEGSLRLVRTGSVLSGFYWNDTTGWVHIHSGPGPSGPTQFAISLWSHDDQFQNQDVRIAVDNLSISAAEIIMLGGPLPAPDPNAIPEGGAAILLLGAAFFCCVFFELGQTRFKRDLAT